ncbi:MAG: carbohydrate kinase family protein [Alphaproteobacteria bacterium]|nr:carbohydrate kinase family protein [Alphaproteobacteria bacterium]
MDRVAPITVIGGANIDISAKYSSAVAAAGDSNQGQISTSAGGVARNIAENLARLGSAVQLITGLGDDEFSIPVRTSLNLPLLDLSACYAPPNTSSDSYLSLYDIKGELVSAVNQMRLVNKLTPSYLQRFEAQITGATLIIADCNLPPDSIYWLAGLPDRPTLFFDGVSMEKITRLQSCLDRINGLKCNRLEAAALLKCSVRATPDQLVDDLHQRGVEIVLLSLGSEGVQLGRSGQQLHFPLLEPPQTIASVAGAGDALLAGFLHNHFNGASDEAAMHFGLRAAQLSLTCTDAVHPGIASICEEQTGAI